MADTDRLGASWGRELLLYGFGLVPDQAGLPGRVRPGRFIPVAAGPGRLPAESREVPA